MFHERLTCARARSRCSRPERWQPKVPFSWCRCQILVVDYRWGSVGSDETAITIPGGLEKLTFFTGTGRHRAQFAHFFRGQVGSWRPLGVGLVAGSRLYRIRHRCGSLVLSESPGSKPWPFIAQNEWTCYRTGRARRTRRVLVRGSGSTMNRHTHIAATKTQRAENEGRGRHTHTTDTLRARCDGRRERSGQRAPDSI